MKQLAALLLIVALAGCSSVQTVPRAAATPLPAPAEPELPRQPLSSLSRDEAAEVLVSLMNEPGKDPSQQLRSLTERLPLDRTSVPWLKADLDGDATPEFVAALPVTDPGASDYRRWLGAALFVIYQKDGRWQVDRTDPMSEGAELRLMAPRLHAVADLAGTGRPQIVWSRPHMIATGPQPSSVFVTAWQPGSFTNLAGNMAISYMDLIIDGRDLVLSGISRGAMFLPKRTDRYRFADGAFRLVDRRFETTEGHGYDRFWDALVAEDSGRTADAAQGYRDAIDPDREPHSGSVPQYKAPPVELTPEELEAFGEALRALARFRLGALLMGAGQQDEAVTVLQEATGPYQGLTEALLRAKSRKQGCLDGAFWVEANPAFLSALNRGAGHRPWTPGIICSHISLEDSLDL